MNKNEQVMYIQKVIVSATLPPHIEGARSLIANFFTEFGDGSLRDLLVYCLNKKLEEFNVQ